MKKMSKHERDLKRVFRGSFSEVAAEVKRFIRDGVGENIGVGTTWSLSNETFVHAVFQHGSFHLRIVIGDTLVAESKRGARRPGIRESDLTALNTMVKLGPSLLVERFSVALKEVLNCGDPIEEVRNLLENSEVFPWSSKNFYDG